MTTSNVEAARPIHDDPHGEPPPFQEFCDRVWDTDESDPVLAIKTKDLKRIFECAKASLGTGTSDALLRLLGRIAERLPPPDSLSPQHGDAVSDVLVWIRNALVAVPAIERERPVANRCTTFPRATGKDLQGGWMLCPTYLTTLSEHMVGDDFRPSLEGIEATLLAVEANPPLVAGDGFTCPTHGVPTDQCGC